MQFLYSIGIRLYGLMIRIAAPFNPKAAQWVNGRKGFFADFSTRLNRMRINAPGQKTAWFHCASLGEFEQGRPLIETFRKEHPDYFIVLTFFSPSGFENRKNYEGADLIFYLPLDTRVNARRFLETLTPDIVFFVKYEFWFNYLNLLQEKNIPHYLVSGIFRADQHFFKWYGDWPRKILKGFTHIFVQNQFSIELLEFVGITNASICGDTRFDRVMEVSSRKKELPVAEAFAEGHLVLVAGSSWTADEELLVRFMSEHPGKIRLIIAPHELHESSLAELKSAFGPRCGMYSSLSASEAKELDVLIIDMIGILSQLYRFGRLAYIGGGFGAGIHNILEAAVYGVPVLFGPNYHKFHEATELVAAKGAFPVHQYKDLQSRILDFIDKKGEIAEAGERCARFVKVNLGATRKILDQVTIP